MKRAAIDVVNDFVAPIRARRSQFQPGDAVELLARGAERAGDIADTTVAEVRSAMGMNHGGLYHFG